MAETLSPRFGFTVWGDASTDGPSMTEFNSAFAALEALAAKDTQGGFALRPAVGEARRYYFATDTGLLYRDDGATWRVVGAKTVDQVIESSNNAAVALSVDTAAGQNAALLRLRVNSVSQFTVAADGTITANRLNAKPATFIGVDSEPGTRVVQITGGVGQTASLLAARNSSGTDQFTVSPTGVIVSTFFGAQAEKAVLGASGYTNLANQSTYAGTTALEVRSTKGGTGAYDDALVLRHPQYTNTAVRRRLGMLIKLGDETTGDAAKAGGLYVESNAADAGSPSVVIQQGDAPAMSFPGTITNAAVIHGRGLQIANTLSVQKTGAESLLFNSDVRHGAQGSSGYIRVGAAGNLYIYAGGVHSDTPGTPGAGGVQLAQFSSTGLLTISRAALTSLAGTSLGEANPPLIIGSANDINMVFSRAGIQARNNGAASLLNLNSSGGTILLGSPTGAPEVGVPGGRFTIGGRRLSILDTAPGSPNVGDVWVDI